MKVNLGCGRSPWGGWINVDIAPLPGVDLVLNLDDPAKITFPWADDSVDELAMVHTLEHLHYPLPLMQECWRVAKPGAQFTVVCPYGSSDDADEDPTHVRRIYLNSFGYFGQPFYHQADYGYRGDWDVSEIVLDVPAGMRRMSNQEKLAAVMSTRNVVTQITAILRAVKPARPPEPVPEGIGILFRVARDDDGSA